MVSSNVILFAVDTKLYTSVVTQADCHTLQEIVKWTEKWLMRFNTEHCLYFIRFILCTQQHTVILFYKGTQLSTIKKRKIVDFFL